MAVGRPPLAPSLLLIILLIVFVVATIVLFMLWKKEKNRNEVLSKTLQQYKSGMQNEWEIK